MKSPSMNQKPSYEELEARITFLEKKAKLVDTLQVKINTNNQFLQILLDTIPNPVFYKDVNCIYQNCNDSFSKMILGIPKEMIIGKTLFDLPHVISNEMAKKYDEKDKELFNNPGIQKYESDVKCIDNVLRSFFIYKATVYNDLKEVVGIVGIMLDITDLKLSQMKLHEKNRELKTLSYIDPLTQVYNRRKFEEIFPSLIKISNRYDHILNFAIIDVDSFKLYNDTYGHYAGDDVLKVISQTVKKRLLREDDYFFRLGGEEFGLLYHSNDEMSALKFADCIRTDIEQLKIEHLNNKGLGTVTISLGLVTIKNLTHDEKYFYEEADKLLYQAKRTGKNRVFSKVI